VNAMLCLLQTSPDSPLVLDAGLASLLSALCPMMLLVTGSVLLVSLFQVFQGRRESTGMLVASVMVLGMTMFLHTMIPAVGGSPVSAESDFDGLGRFWPILWHSTVAMAGVIATGSAFLPLRRKQIEKQKIAAEAARAVEQRFAFLNWLENEFLKLQIDTLPGMTEQQRFLLERMAWAAQQTFDARQLEEVWKELRCALGEAGDHTPASKGSPV